MLMADSLTGSILTSPLPMMRPRYSMEGVLKVHLESLTERLFVKALEDAACSFMMEFKGTGGMES